MICIASSPDGLNDYGGEIALSMELITLENGIVCGVFPNPSKCILSIPTGKLPPLTSLSLSLSLSLSRVHTLCHLLTHTHSLSLSHSQPCHTTHYSAHHGCGVTCPEQSELLCRMMQHLT